MTIKIGLVGIGKIARDQHIPVINEHSAFELVAVASAHSELAGINNFESLDEMLSKQSDLDAVVICTPPQVRYELARQSIERNKHVLLEKPPGASLTEVEELAKLASSFDVTLYNSWHSRHALSTETAKSLLQTAVIHSVDVQWLEDVRKWHPEQKWIWQPGGLGVFDPGINALSIVTHVLPSEFRLQSADLSFPENKQTPIAAILYFEYENGAPIKASFDWRKEGKQLWNINIESDVGSVLLTEGGSRLFVDGEEQTPKEKKHRYQEYSGVYDRFQYLIDNEISDADCRPLTLTADAFMMANRTIVDPFLDS